MPCRVPCHSFRQNWSRFVVGPGRAASRSVRWVIGSAAGTVQSAQDDNLYGTLVRHCTDASLPSWTSCFPHGLPVAYRTVVRSTAAAAAAAESRRCRVGGRDETSACDFDKFVGGSLRVWWIHYDQSIAPKLPESITVVRITVLQPRRRTTFGYGS